MTRSGVAALMGNLMRMQTANVIQSSNRFAEAASRMLCICCTIAGASSWRQLRSFRCVRKACQLSSAHVK